MKDRAATKRAMPVTQLAMRHTGNCRVVPTREQMLDLLPKNGIVAEVGVAFGDFSKELLERMQPQTLHLLDLWMGERYKSGLDTVTSHFKSEIEAGRVQLRQGRSVETLASFADQTFDFVYIDTDHSYVTTIAELEVARNKVKQGGRIGGHDYCTGNIVGAVPYGVVEACAEFCGKYDWTFEYLSLESHGHFSFCLKAIN
jgi:Methyltransferase domain